MSSMEEQQEKCVAKVLDSSTIVATLSDAVSLCSSLVPPPEPGSSFSDFSSVWDWVSVVGVFGCVALAALAAGLTMGIVSLEALELRVKVRTGDAGERSHAERLLPLVERNPHHQVLVTLLLVNSVANEALPLFLDQLVPSWCAILLSVSAVLLLGEVLPSALFAGSSRLRLASAFVPLVSFFIVLVSPIAYPLSLLLDRFMPEETQFTTRQELHALVEVERDLAAELEQKEPFTENESKLVLGTLSLAQKRVKDVMVPIDRVYTVHRDTVCDASTKAKLASAGFSRIPLHYHENTADKLVFSSYVLVKELLGVVDETAVLCRTPAVRDPLSVGQDDSLYSLLQRFQSGESHIAFVSDRDEAVGIVTLEDIIEEIMDEIYDEKDLNVASSKISHFFKANVGATTLDKEKKTNGVLLKRQKSRRLAPRRQESRGRSDSESSSSRRPSRPPPPPQFPSTPLLSMKTLSSAKLKTDENSTAASYSAVDDAL